jgi:hypothetical protein
MTPLQITHEIVRLISPHVPTARREIEAHLPVSDLVTLIETFAYSRGYGLKEMRQAMKDGDYDHILLLTTHCFPGEGIPKPLWTVPKRSDGLYSSFGLPVKTRKSDGTLSLHIPSVMLFQIDALKFREAMDEMANIIHRPQFRILDPRLNPRGCATNNPDSPFILTPSTYFRDPPVAPTQPMVVQHGSNTHTFHVDATLTRVSQCM